LLKATQIHSDAWEAAYLKRPNFDPQLNFGLWTESLGEWFLTATIGGHLIQKSDGQFFSVEVLAVHPDHQKLGYAQKLISFSLKHLDKSCPIIFWTRCPNANAWYERQEFKLIEEKQLQEARLTHRDHLGVKLTPQQINTWCYAISGESPPIFCRSFSHGGNTVNNPAST
jgi:GNAT superfamily N-acetyltransferase